PFRAGERAPSAPGQGEGRQRGRRRGGHLLPAVAPKVRQASERHQPERVRRTATAGELHTFAPRDRHRGLQTHSKCKLVQLVEQEKKRSRTWVTKRTSLPRNMQE